MDGFDEDLILKGNDFDDDGVGVTAGVPVRMTLTTSVVKGINEKNWRVRRISRLPEHRSKEEPGYLVELLTKWALNGNNTCL